MQEKELKTQALVLPEKAGFITVHSQTTLDRANEFLKTVKVFRKNVKDFFGPIKKNLNKAKSELMERINFLDNPAEKAEKIVKKEIERYLAEQEEKRLKAEEEARQEKEKAFEKAREAEKLGFEEEAEKIRKEETKLATPLPPPVKAEGTHLRKNWTYEVTDITKVPREYLVLDSVKVNAIVRADKEKTNIPGIRAYQETSVSTRI